MKTFALLLFSVLAANAQQINAVVMIPDAAHASAGMKSRSGAGALAAMISAVPAGSTSTISVPSGYAETLTSSLTVNKANVTLIFTGGSLLTTGGTTVTPLIVSASHVSIQGATIKGQRSVHGTYTGNGILLFGVSAISDITITGGSITDTGSDPIYVQDNVSRVTIRDVIADSSGSASGSHTIGVHTATAGAVMSDILIEHNHLTCGGTAANFCIEVGNFISGLPSAQNPTNVRALSNDCALAGTGANGCISYQAVDHGTADRNYMDAGGLVVGLQFIELVCSSYITASGNKLVNTRTDNVGGINLDGSHHSTLIANELSGLIYAGTSRTSPAACTSVSDNNIALNVLAVPSAAVPAKAVIWIQCSAAAAVCSNNSVTRNTILGNSAAGLICIDFQNDNNAPGGTIADANMVALNSCYGATYGLGTSGIPATNMIAAENYYDAATVTNAYAGYAASEFAQQTDVGQAWVVRGAPAFTNLQITSGIGTGTNSNTDMAGFITLGAAGTDTLAWPSGHTYSVGPGCAATGYDATGIIRAQPGGAAVVFTSSVGAADSGKIVQYHCDFHVF